MAVAKPHGVLLVNLGTPDSPEVSDVRRYLREFLSDPRVIDLPGPARWLLLHAIILPLRPRRSAEAYRKIWSEEGSPQLVHGHALCAAVAAELGDDYRVELAMRYGEPSLARALDRLREAGVERVSALPLFPQHAEATSGSVSARLDELDAEERVGAPVDVAGDFHADPGLIGAWAEVAGPLLERFQPDHTLLSYHGLPRRQIQKGDPLGEHCLASPDCCTSDAARRGGCYRAQCFGTSRALALALGLDPARTTTSFQSRLGRGWIEPYTDAVLPELAAAGVRRLAVLSPAFVADCLETLEELGIRGRAQWEAQGGEDFLLVPCPNAHPAFARAVADLIRRG